MSRRRHKKRKDKMIHEFDGWGSEGRWWEGDESPQVPAGPPDPVIVRAVTDYRVYQAPEDLSSLTKPLTWFLAGNGVVPVRNTPLGAFIGKAVGPTTLGLPPLAPGVRLNCPKVSWEVFTQVIAFFQAINAKMEAEAMIQVFWDPSEGVHVVHAPKQRVSGGGVDHAGHFDKEGAFWHLLDIHSHNTMAPFWSGTDNADEARFEGRFFGVVGHVDRAIPETKWRMRAGGDFVDLLLTDVIETSNVPPMVVTATKTFSIPSLIGVANGGNAPDDNTRFYFEVDPFGDATFPKEWLEAVTERGHYVHSFPGTSLDDDAMDDVVDTPTSRVEYRGTQPDEKEVKRLEGMGLVMTSPGVWERPSSSRMDPSYVYDRSTKTLYCRAAGTGDIFPSCFTLAHIVNSKASVSYVDNVDKLKIVKHPASVGGNSGGHGSWRMS